jgi:hypothetical protein
MIRSLIEYLIGNPWPNAIPLPPHVQAVRLNPNLLFLHMSEAEKPTDRTKGFKK